ncbi:hypothetical protein HPB47_026853, partial [Ixodes persulcatus]
TVSPQGTYEPEGVWGRAPRIVMDPESTVCLETLPSLTVRGVPVFDEKRIPAVKPSPGTFLWGLASCSFVESEVTSGDQHVGAIGRARPEPIAEDALECDLETVAERFDCHPEGNASENACVLRGCCWEVLDDTVDETVENSAGIPRCFFPKHYLGYSVQGAQTSIDRITVQLKRRTPSGIDVDVPLVQVQVLSYDRYTVRIKCDKQKQPKATSLEPDTFAI